MQEVLLKMEHQFSQILMHDSGSHKGNISFDLSNGISASSEVCKSISHPSIQSFASSSSGHLLSPEERSVRKILHRNKEKQFVSNKDIFVQNLDRLFKRIDHEKILITVPNIPESAVMLTMDKPPFHPRRQEADVPHELSPPQPYAQAHKPWLGRQTKKARRPTRRSSNLMMALLFSVLRPLPTCKKRLTSSSTKRHRSDTCHSISAPNIIGSFHSPARVAGHESRLSQSPDHRKVPRTIDH